MKRLCWKASSPKANGAEPTKRIGRVDGRVGVLGHVASFDEAGDRHYYPMAFVFDPSGRIVHGDELIAERSRFLPGPSKWPDLQDVVFSGGLVRREDGSRRAVRGHHDADAQRIVIADPFPGSVTNPGRTRDII